MVVALARASSPFVPEGLLIIMCPSMGVLGDIVPDDGVGGSRRGMEKDECLS